MSSLRVRHVGKFYPPAAGGIETFVYTLAHAQAELGLQVEVICMNDRPGPTVRERDGSIDVARFARRGTFGGLEFCPGLVPALRRTEADILHLHVPNPTMILALIAARPKAPVVVTYQSDHVRQRLRGALFRFVENRFYRRVAAIFATSPPYADCSPLLRRFADRVCVIPMGIDLQEYSQPSVENQRRAAQIRARHPGPLWLGCGRLIYYKGFLNAVRALRHVPGTLLIVGEGPKRASLEAEAERLSVRDRLVLVGALPFQDIVPYYLAAEAFWLPSNARSEAFGVVQLEAMAAGCPVINTSIPGSGVSWVSRHEESGLTVPMDDPEMLAQAANRLLEDRALRDRLSAAARKRAHEDFDHRVMARRTLDAYERALAGSGLGRTSRRVA